MTVPTTDGARQLDAWRREIARARSGRDILDQLLSPKDAVRRVRALPVEDLHRALTRIGLEDAHDVLALASDTQIRGLIDIDAWTGAHIELARLDEWLGGLMRAGPETLTRGMLSLDDELLNWIVRRSVQSIVVDEPEEFEAPEEEHVLTPDGRLCVVFPRSEARDLPAKVFLDWLMRLDPAFCYNLLVFADAALDSNLEEGAHRWRQGRMADLGYADPIEALSVYAAPVGARASVGPRDPELPPPPERWLEPVVDREARLHAAMAALDDEARAHAQEALGWLCNMAIAADRVPAWDEERQRAVLERVRAGLGLGLSALSAGAGPEADAEVLRTVQLTDVFRHGYARMLEAAEPVRAAAREGLLQGAGGPVDAVDVPELARWAAALAAHHPHHPDDHPFQSAAELVEARAQAELIAELARAAGRRRPEAVGVGAYLFTWMTRALLGISEAAGPLPPDRLGAAHRAWFDTGAIRAESRAAAEAFWRQIGGAETRTVARLLNAAADELAHVAEADLEPRFSRFWWVNEASLPAE